MSKFLLSNSAFMEFMSFLIFSLTSIKSCLEGKFLRPLFIFFSNFCNQSSCSFSRDSIAFVLWAIISSFFAIMNCSDFFLSSSIVFTFADNTSTNLTCSCCEELTLFDIPLRSCFNWSTSDLSLSLSVTALLYSSFR